MTAIVIILLTAVTCLGEGIYPIKNSHGAITHYAIPAGATDTLFARSQRLDFSTALVVAQDSAIAALNTQVQMQYASIENLQSTLRNSAEEADRYKALYNASRPSWLTVAWRRVQLPLGIVVGVVIASRL